MGARLICFNPKTDDLQAYADNMAARFRMLAASPADGVASFAATGAQTIIMHRHGKFQTELCIFAPGTVIPEHRHPGVDTVEMLVSGMLAYKINGEAPQYEARWLRRNWSPRFKAIRIEQHEVHSVEVGAQGVAFLSFQRWDSGAPVHIGDNWIGRGCSSAHETRWGAA
jgi:hypothetical protein